MKKRRSKTTTSRSKDISKRNNLQNRVNESGDSGEDVNPSDFFHDEIDDFHCNQEKILLSGDVELTDEDSSDEEVLPITEDEDSSLEDKETGEDEEEEDQYVDEEKDLESDYHDKSDDDLPNLDAWGKKTSLYYNADFVDKDRGKSYREEDAEKAKAEESGAVYVQSNFLNQVREDVYESDSSSEDEIADEPKLRATEKDCQVIEKNEKLMTLKRNSPEFFVLVTDFKEKMKELLEHLEPLLGLVKDGRLPPGNGAQYIIIRYHLILHYCTNISFYMALKSKCIDAKYHPVMKRLNSYKLLLNKLDSLGEKLKPEINAVLQKLEAGEEICVKEKSGETEDDCMDNDDVQDSLQEHTSEKGASAEKSYAAKKLYKKRKVNELSDTEIEKEISSLYMDMKKRQRGHNIVEDSEDEENVLDGKELETQNDNDNFGEKRAVTYQIAKNKGILPYRKKEYRNPRVRNRMKFRKAKIRRKGQVREPRKEIHRYGGELTGIRSNVTKSIKIK